MINGSERRAQSSGLRTDSVMNLQSKNIMEDFRFEKLEIWKDSIEISDPLFDIADKADEKRYYKFAEQLRAATMSI